MTLSLVGEFKGVTVPCPTCAGKGRVPLQNCKDQAGENLISNGFPVPCPECKGKRVVTRVEPFKDEKQ